jgi:DNA helicase-2/ATP-dependent DNA helicase PcrA
MHGMWQTTAPSRFLDELPEAHVEVTESKGGFGWAGTAPSRFDTMESFASNYETPGWQRAQANRAKRSGFDEAGRNGNGGPAARRRRPLTIEGELVARSTGPASQYGIGERVFHQKFGYGDIVSVDGNKLTVAFDKAGEKRVVDSYVERA